MKSAFVLTTAFAVRDLFPLEPQCLHFALVLLPEAAMRSHNNNSVETVTQCRLMRMRKPRGRNMCLEKSLSLAWVSMCAACPCAPSKGCDTKPDRQSSAWQGASTDRVEEAPKIGVYRVRGGRLGLDNGKAASCCYGHPSGCDRPQKHHRALRKWPKRCKACEPIRGSEQVHVSVG